MRREGLVHHGIELRFNRRGHRIDLHGLTGGRAITVYAQHEIVKDLIEARMAYAGPIIFEVDSVRIVEFAGKAPRVCFRSGERSARSRATTSPVAMAFTGSAVRPLQLVSCVATRKRIRSAGWEFWRKPHPPPRS